VISTSQRRLGVGIVGLSASGGWAAAAHVPALNHVDGYELRALSASSHASAHAAGEKFGVALTFGNAHDLATCDDVDMVVITVKVPEHRELVLDALDAGKVVLCEWPLGNGVAEAEEMADAAADKGLPAFVGLQARSAPTVRFLRDLIADGYVGEVLSTSVIGSGGAWGAMIDSRNAYLLDRKNGGTMLTIPFGHTIDALTMVLGEFVTISATTATRRTAAVDTTTGQTLPMTAEDQIAVAGVLESDAVASVHFRGGMSRGTNLLWEINGTDGDLVITGDSGQLQFETLTLRGARGGESALTELTVPPDYARAHPSLLTEAPHAYNVANAYAQIRADLAAGTQVAPTFAHAVIRQRFLERIAGGAGN
jgi:predicted dehydrogenase